jgi:hypothetical protein
MMEATDLAQRLDAAEHRLAIAAAVIRNGECTDDQARWLMVRFCQPAMLAMPDLAHHRLALQRSLHLSWAADEARRIRLCER